MPKGKKTEKAPAETLEDDSPGDGTNLYERDEKVLADNNNMIYKSLVRNKKQQADGEWAYFVHYDGWNKKWDAWVAEALLMKFTDENVTKMNELNKKTKDAIKAKKDKSKKPAEVKPQDEKTSKKRKMDQQRELEEFLEPQVRVPIPFLLKKTLVDDWEWVTRSNLLVPLARKPTVQDILRKYLDGKLKKKTGPSAATTLNIHQEFADGLQDYFDRALGTILLYRHERVQYQGFRDEQPKAQASSHYGAEHLLRLFVRLPTLLANTDLSDAELSVLQLKIADFLKFLVKNHEEFFCNSYVAAEEPSSKKGAAKAAVKSETASTVKDEAAAPAQEDGVSMED